VFGDENDAIKPSEVTVRPAAEGKLDLLTVLDFRMSTTCLYGDIVLPTATWYEKDDLNTSDMHPFIHPLSEACSRCGKARRLGNLQGDREDVQRDCWPTWAHARIWSAPR
jgi:nitrate reductase alpha subunit